MGNLSNKFKNKKLNKTFDDNNFLVSKGELNSFEIIDFNNEINNNIINNEIINNFIINNNNNFEYSFYKPQKKIPSTKDFNKKISGFKLKIKSLYKLTSSITLLIDRKNIIESSITELKKLKPTDEIYINFLNEEGIDSGGLLREWLNLLFKELFDEKNCLFTKSENDEISYLISPNFNKNQEEKFILIGTLIARALKLNLTLNCFFNIIIFKIILNEEINLNDLVFIDKQLYKSLKNLINFSEKENLNNLEMFFCIDEKINGKIITKELIKNGKKIKVTNNNLNEFINARINYLINSQLKGTELIIKGIKKELSLNIFNEFTSNELNLLINGVPFIDIDDWMQNTNYINYTIIDEVIINFWEVVSNLNQEQLSKFLFFVTGSSRVPIDGFKALESRKGNSYKFTIQRIAYDPERTNYCKAHTCFNRLDLPEFETKKEVEDAIFYCLNNEVLVYDLE